MKRLYVAIGACLFIFLAIVIFSSCQRENSTHPSNPLVGTWKPLGPVDSKGKVVETFEGEIGYQTLLEDGSFYFIGFRKSFPKTGGNPTTLEEYEKIANTSWGRIGTYSVDLDNHKVLIKYSHDLRPESIGNETSANYKVVGDTATYWSDNSKYFYRYLKVK